MAGAVRGVVCFSGRVALETIAAGAVFSGWGPTPQLPPRDDAHERRAPLVVDGEQDLLREAALVSGPGPSGADARPTLRSRSSPATRRCSART